MQKSLEILGYAYFLIKLDLFNVSERTIFAKVKSSIYYILSNLIPVTNSEENESLELSCLNSWLSASVLVYLHFEFSANWCS